MFTLLFTLTLSEFATTTERMGPLVVGGESKKGDMRSILRIHAHQLGKHKAYSRKHTSGYKWFRKREVW